MNLKLDKKSVNNLFNYYNSVILSNKVLLRLTVPNFKYLWYNKYGSGFKTSSNLPDSIFNDVKLQINILNLK